MRALSLLFFLTLAGSATAAVLSGSGEPSAQASAVAAEGSFSFANSREGMPIFSATEIGPGDSASGTVEIANTGTLPGELALAQNDVADVPGSGGGELSERLSMRITDITAPANPATVYAGPLAPMPSQPAGQLEPGESRTYEFVATLPEAGSASAQNGVQGASTSVAYSWTASEVAPAASPEPAPAGPAGSSPAPVPLRLTIIRVRHTIRHGRLLVLARCNAPCAIGVRGRLRARGATGHRNAKLRLSRRPHFVTGVQRVSIRLPGHLIRWLKANPERLRIKARIFLLARNLDETRVGAAKHVCTLSVQ